MNLVQGFYLLNFVVVVQPFSLQQIESTFCLNYERNNNIHRFQTIMNQYSSSGLRRAERSGLGVKSDVFKEF